MNKVTYSTDTFDSGWPFALNFPYNTALQRRCLKYAGLPSLVAMYSGFRF